MFLTIGGALCLAALLAESPETTTSEAPSAVQEAQGAAVELPALLDLESAQRIALEQNPSLQAAEARIEQARQRVKQARSAYFPQISAGWTGSVTELSDQVYGDAKRAVAAGQISGLSRTLLNSNIPLNNKISSTALALIGIKQGQDAIDDTIEGYRADLSAFWLIFDGFGREFSVAAAKFGALASEASHREAQRLILSAVARTYYGVQLARENIAIANADEEFNRRQLTEAEARRRVGTGALSDVLNFEIRVRAAQNALLTAEGSYKTVLIGLMALMGVSDAKVPEGLQLAELHPERPEEMQSPDAESLTAHALQNRPDMMSAKYARLGAEKGVGIQKSAYWPSVSAFASRDGARTRNGFFETDDFSSTVGMSINYDIYTGGRRKAALKGAKAAQVEADRNAESLALGVAEDVRRSVVDLATSQQVLLLQRQTTEFVERNRDLVEKEYRAGQGSLVRLNEAQRDLIAQQSRLALARVAVRVAWHDLRTATAETLEAFSDPEAQK